MSITATADGVRIRFRVQPSAARSEIAGPHGDTIRIRLAAPPVDGKANDELVRTLAGLLGVSRSDVTLRTGAGSRTKVVDVRGIDRPTAIRLLLGD